MRPIITVSNATELLLKHLLHWSEITLLKIKKKDVSKEVAVYKINLPDSESLGFKASFSPFAKERRYPFKNPRHSSIGISSHFTNIESEEVSSTIKFGALFGAVGRIMKEETSKKLPHHKMLKPCKYFNSFILELAFSNLFLKTPHCKVRVKDLAGGATKIHMLD